MTEVRKTSAFSRTGCRNFVITALEPKLQPESIGWRLVTPVRLNLSEKVSANCESILARVIGFIFVRRGMTFIVLLCGGDKTTQNRDIKTAKILAANLEK